MLPLNKQINKQKDLPIFKTISAFALVIVTVILLQIVMVSPGTHLVKNHESQFKNTSPWVFLYVTAQFNINTYRLKTLYYSLLK